MFIEPEISKMNSRSRGAKRRLDLLTIAENIALRWSAGRAHNRGQAPFLTCKLALLEQSSCHRSGFHKTRVAGVNHRTTSLVKTNSPNMVGI